MAINPNQIQDKPKTLSASASAPDTDAGGGTFYTKDVGGIIEAFYLDSNGNEIQITTGGVVNAAGAGEVNTAVNIVGLGAGVFKTKSGAELQFRKILAGSNITVTENPDSVEISGPPAAGETNTGSNVGAGNQVFKQKSGVDLEFRSLVAGNNITMNAGADTITIEAADGVGEANTASNVGTGDGQVFKQKTLSDLEMRTIKAGANVTITNNPDDITVASSFVDENIKVSANDTTAGDLSTKLIAGAGITLTEDNDGGNETLTVSCSNIDEYKFTIGAGATVADRIAATTVPAGWTLEDGATGAAGTPFDNTVDTLIVTHGGTSKLTGDIRVYEVTTGAPTVAKIEQAIPTYLGTGNDTDVFMNDSTGTKFQIKNLQALTDNAKDLILYVKLV